MIKCPKCNEDAVMKRGTKRFLFICAVCHHRLSPSERRRVDPEQRQKWLDKKMRYYNKHKAEILIRGKLFRESNKDAVKERRKVYYENNKEKIKERIKLKRVLNPEMFRSMEVRKRINHKAEVNKRDATRRRRHMLSLSDSYIKRLLKRNYGLNNNFITPELIAGHRVLVILGRIKAKEFNNNQEALYEMGAVNLKFLKERLGSNNESQRKRRPCV